MLIDPYTSSQELINFKFIKKYFALDINLIWIIRTNNIDICNRTFLIKLRNRPHIKCAGNNNYH